MEKKVICTIPTGNDDFQIDILSDGYVRITYFEDGHYKDETKFKALDAWLKFMSHQYLTLFKKYDIIIYKVKKVTYSNKYKKLKLGFVYVNW